jgi:hypothetical protein
VNLRVVRSMLILATVAACAKNPTPGKPTPASQPKSVSAPPVNLEGPQPVGAATARGAIDVFLEAARTQDIQAMSAVWGSTQGAARDYTPHDQTEKRLLIMMCFLKHDKSAVGAPSAAAGGRLEFPVTLTQGDLTRSTTMTTIPGPAGRYYVETFDMKAVEPLCQERPANRAPQQ